jgi:hypothetical protein
MKAPKFLLAGLLALSTMGVAQAQTVIHITGSTAYRSAVHEAITNFLSPGFHYGYSGGTFTKASQAIFTGANDGIPVIIKTSWSGSLAGVETVSQAIPGATVSTFLVNSTPQTTAGASNAPAVYDPPIIPEVAMEDGEQATTQYPRPALTQVQVGVVGFKFVVNTNGSTIGLTNITPLLARALWTDGQLPLSMFNGNSNSTTPVYALGRDWDSGTRNCAFLETGVQSFVSSLSPTAVKQWAPTNSAGALVSGSNPGPVVTQGLWPCETIDYITECDGDGGYGSGGDLAAAMSASSPYIYVAYLGLSDASTVEGNLGTSVDLTYNGIAYSANAVENGQYTFWCYEYLDYLPSYSTTSPNGYTVANNLATAIANENLLSVGVNLSLMNVTRNQEGGPVIP